MSKLNAKITEKIIAAAAPQINNAIKDLISEIPNIGIYTMPKTTNNNKPTTINQNSNIMKPAAATTPATETPVIETAAAAQPATPATPAIKIDKKAVAAAEKEIKELQARIEATPAAKKNDLKKLNHQLDVLKSELLELKNPTPAAAPKTPEKVKITTDKLELTTALIDANLKPKTRKSVLLKSQIMTEEELKASHPDFATDYQYIPMHEYIELVFLAKEYYAKQIEAAKQTVVNKIS